MFDLLPPLKEFHHSPAFTRHFTPKIYPASMLRPGEKTGNHKPACTVGQAAKHVTISRNLERRAAFEVAMEEINRVAGGDPRRVRRAMARVKGKRK